MKFLSRLLGFWLAVLGAAAGAASNATAPEKGTVERNGTILSSAADAKRAPPARQTWGNLASLRDHFERHGADFNAKNAEDYARMAWEFLQRAKTGGHRAKLDDDGVLRVFDPKTRAFAAYNKNGTTKTFFKSTSRDYFDRQPGREINLAAKK